MCEMIIKNKEERELRSANQKKGDAAESQMAFYLRRHFSDCSEIHVLNDVYLTLNEEVAQIDHLVITPYRLWIIESKSVSGRIVILDDGQWIKRFEGREFGFKSPIQQATLQAKILRGNYRKYFKGINRQPLKESILIAISSEGVIEDQRTQRGDVLKADLVPNRILEVYEQDKGAADAMPWGVYKAMADEYATYFLLASDVCNKAKSGARLPDDANGLFARTVAADITELLQATMNEDDHILMEFCSNPKKQWLFDEYFEERVHQEILALKEFGTTPRYVECMCTIAAFAALQEKAATFWDDRSEKLKMQMKKAREMAVQNGTVPRLVRSRPAGHP